MSTPNPNALGVIREVVATRVSDAALRDDTPLLSSGLIDSMSIVDLIVDLEARLGVKIPASEVQPDDFDSVAKIVETVARFS